MVQHACRVSLPTLFSILLTVIRCSYILKLGPDHMNCFFAHPQLTNRKNCLFLVIWYILSAPWLWLLDMMCVIATFLPRFILFTDCGIDSIRLATRSITRLYILSYPAGPPHDVMRCSTERSIPPVRGVVDSSLPPAWDYQWLLWKHPDDTGARQSTRRPEGAHRSVPNTHNSQLVR